MKSLKKRTEFPKFFDEMGYKIGAEVGVYKGRFSAHILQHSNVDILYNIDQWRDIEGNVMYNIFDECKATLKQFGNRSKIIHLSSIKAVRLFKDGELDFCHIDADHRYKAVKDDLELWYPKVRIGGMLLGHDYSPRGSGLCIEQTTNKFPERYLKGVIQAVDEFVAKYRLKLFLTSVGCASWWIIK